jgi:hypothetical protein
MTLAISGTTGITLAGQFDSASTFGWRNRIINGGMVIDQRNAGASVTFATTYAYYLDRWQGIFASGSGSRTIQQSTTAPAGFNYSLLVTNGTAATPAAGDRNSLVYGIEGYNVADLGWGTANAATATLSFWVRSSLTGTFSGAFQNGTSARSYPFTYTISSANTWEQKTITVVGDITGTWNTTNGNGMQIWFDLGTGSTYQGTAGAWTANDYRAVTGSVKLVSTSSATFYITGVQLEKGSTATSFDFRSYGTELALCQRYFQSYNGDGGAVKAVMPYQSAASTGELDAYMVLPVRMRSAPTAAISNLTAYDGNTAAASLTSITTYNNTSSIFGCYFGVSGLTAFRPYMVMTASGTTGYLQLSAEL